MDHPIRLGRRHVQQAALLCEEAFRASSFTRYLFPAAEPLDPGVIAMFEFIIRYATLYGEAYAPSEAIQGVACWYSENSYSPSLWRMIRAGGLPPTLRNRGAWKRLVALEPYLTKARKKWMHGPHFYLDLFAVRPGLHGQGFGGTLLRYMLSRADTNHVPCYVETFKESNIAMYQHFGFSVEEAIQTTPIGEAVYFMVRTPGTRGCEFQDRDNNPTTIRRQHGENEAWQDRTHGIPCRVRRNTDTEAG